MSLFAKTDKGEYLLRMSIIVPKGMDNPRTVKTGILYPFPADGALKMMCTFSNYLTVLWFGKNTNLKVRVTPVTKKERENHNVEWVVDESLVSPFKQGVFQ